MRIARPLLKYSLVGKELHQMLLLLLVLLWSRRCRYRSWLRQHRKHAWLCAGGVRPAIAHIDRSLPCHANAVLSLDFIITRHCYLQWTAR